MKTALGVILGLSLIVLSGPRLFAAEKLLAGFEQDAEGWEIPDWAMENNDYIADSLAVSSDYAREGKKALVLRVGFPGGKWSAAYIETVDYFDWTAYGGLAVDVYLPDSDNAAAGLKARMILTAGQDWRWVEMSKAIPLEPGKWTTVAANLKPASADWKSAVITDAFRQDIRKLGIRIESDRQPVYDGPIYIDNLRLID